ncbi:ribosomal RNA small subunit methyltransferase A, partial [Candidatus Saccharibacteria bacterium]|nr:ribosomal RNA small subunit methyltransferase A [Candidatus Saccharibacteria bacterium]
MTETNKSLGQHWLYDEEILESIVQCANIKQGDDVIEVGPGLGTLTDILVKSGANITAVEYDKNLFNKLSKKYSNNSLRLVNEDILKFNFGAFKGTYKIV